MTSIDIKSLIAPFSSDNPVGQDIRSDSSPVSVYYKIKDARNTARDIERKNQMFYETNEVSSSWQLVIDTAVEILKKKSKDLEVAVWLLEAWIRQYQLNGLNAGLCLITDLISNYWDALYPLPDEEGLESRLMPLVGLNGEDSEGTLIQPIRDLPITDSGVDSAYSFWQYKQAIELERVTNPKIIQSRIQDGAIQVEHILQAVEASGADFYRELMKKTQEVHQALSVLNEVLNEKCGNQAPSISQIRSAIEDYADHLHFLMKSASFGDRVEGVLNESKHLESSNALDSQTQENIMLGSISTRAEALSALKSVSEFFKRSEPQSPIPYLVDRAIKWAGLSLPDLLNELIRDDKIRGDAFKLTGIVDPSYVSGN